MTSKKVYALTREEIKEMMREVLIENGLTPEERSQVKNILQWWSNAKTTFWQQVVKVIATAFIAFLIASYSGIKVK